MSTQDVKHDPRQPLIIERPAKRTAQPERPEPRFPSIVTVRGRHYVRRSDFDGYKAELYAAALGVEPIEPPRVEPEVLVPLKMVARELGVGRRTVGRQIQCAVGPEASEERGERAAS